MWPMTCCAVCPIITSLVSLERALLIGEQRCQHFMQLLPHSIQPFTFACSAWRGGISGRTGSAVTARSASATPPERRGHLMAGAPRLQIWAPNLEPRASFLKRMPRAAEG